MITVTPEAAKQMFTAAKQNNAEGLPLRIAVQRREDGSFQYGMGFEDNRRENDLLFSSAGIEVVVSPISLELLKGTVVDFVEFEPGQYQFIFLNPNDPNYQPANRA